MDRSIRLNWRLEKASHINSSKSSAGIGNSNFRFLQDGSLQRPSSTARRKPQSYTISMKNSATVPAIARRQTRHDSTVIQTYHFSARLTGPDLITSNRILVSLN
ncbi:MAG: hypothetical protein M0Z45_09010 [Actinomycetota bacterium]|nr:hypothetical protein [Actinomycetota bacterium]